MKRVYLEDGSPFYGKCAYCETRILGSQPGDIEHFRPKGRVTDEAGNTVMVPGPDGNQVPHPGYYWLAYDWRNLLYACADCNRPSNFKTGGVPIGKRDRFPVMGAYATSPGGERDEHPVLLNPLIDEPENHLSIDETGILGGLSQRGTDTIRILGLNLRESLVSDRVAAMEQVKETILALAVACANGHFEEQERKMRKLNDAKSGALPFSMAQRSAIRHQKPSFQPLLDILDA